MIAASGASACTDNQGTKYSACSCDTSVYGKTDDICKREGGKNAVVSGARCPIDSQYGTDCSCTVTCDPGFSTTPCGAMGEAATADDGCGGKCYKCNTVACDEAGTCETGCPVPTNVGATTVTSCSQLTDAIAAKAENIIIGANFSCSSPVTLSNCQNLVGSGFFDGSANKTLTFSVGTGSGIKIPSSAYIANLDLKASSKRTSGNHGVIQLTSSSSKLTLKDTNISYSLFSDSYNNNGSYGYAGISGDYKASRVSFVGKNTIISNNPSVYYNYAIHLASVVMKEDSSLKASTTGYGGYLIIGGASVTFGKNSVIDLKSTGTYGIGIDFVSKIDMSADNATLNITTSGSNAFAFRHREEDTKINMGSTAVMNLNASAGMFDMETTNSNKFTMTAKLGAQVDNKGTVYTCTTEVKGDKITAVNTLPPGFTHCSGSNYCGYLCVKDNRPKQTVYENITTGLIGDNTCVNSFFAYDSRDFNGNTITLKNITTHLKVNRPDSGSFWPYSKRAYLALIYGDTVYLEGTHNLTLEGAVDFAACGTGCNIRSQSGATINLNGTCYKLPAGYHYQCSGNCFEKTPPNAGTCDGTCPIPQESGATTVTTCSQLTSAVAAGTRTIIVGGSFTCTQGISLNANQSLVGSGYFSGSASKPTITFNLSSATAGISAGNCSTIANLGIKYSSSSTAQYVGALTVKGKEDVQIKNVDITSSISASTVVLTGALDISGSSSVTVSEKLSISNSGKYAGGIKTSASKLEIASATVTATTNGTGAYGLATDNGGTLTISGSSDVSITTTGTGASYSSPTVNTTNVVLRYSNAQVNIKDSARLTLSASGGNTFLIEGAGSSSSQSVKLTETASLSLVKGSASNIYAINRSRINMGSQTSITSSAQNTIYGSYFTAAAGASYTSGSSKSVCSSAISSKYVNSVTTPF